jgi:hypothetical protein
MSDRRKRPRASAFDADLDAELLDQANELASEREGTINPGRAAVRRAVRDLLDERRRRKLSAEARAALGAGEIHGLDGGDVDGDGPGAYSGRELEDWNFGDD